MLDKILGWLDCLKYDSYFGGDYVVEMKVTVREMDTEWLKLIIEAKKMGLKKEEIRDFLVNSGVKEIVLKG